MSRRLMAAGLRFGVVVLLFGVAPATPVAIAKEVPYLAAPVVDLAGMIPDATERELDDELRAFQRKTGDQVAVLTIESLDGAPLEEYSLEVAQTWGLGQKGKDNGVLLLVSRNDRKMRIEVGYGLEPVLTDAEAGRIIDGVLRPRFQQGAFGPGIRAGVDAILAALEGGEVPAVAADRGGGGGAVSVPARLGIGLVFLVVVGVFSLTAIFSKGCGSWFLYAFLCIFWLVFPLAIAGPTVGLALFVAWLVGFPLLKAWFGRSAAGKRFVHRHGGWTRFATSGLGSSHGGFSGGGFSGGGGSFGGGGASGGW